VCTGLDLVNAITFPGVCLLENWVIFKREQTQIACPKDTDKNLYVVELEGEVLISNLLLSPVVGFF